MLADMDMDTTTTATDSSDSTMMEELDVDNLCLHDLFLDQVKKTPDAIAVVDGNVELTYKELDALTSTLAIQLIEEYDVQPDAVVGILLPRSAQYVISYVAILKAGGAYMPLELVYPKTLLERSVTETGCKVVLTNAMYANRVHGHEHIVLLDEAPFVDYNNMSPALVYPPPSYQRPHADNLAFCVMSSGTTGTPKGICQTHRAAVHSYRDRFTRFPYHAVQEDGNHDNGAVVSDRVGAGVFFVWELYRPLCQGATCVIIPDHVLFDPEAVTSFVQDQDITRLLLTPSLLQLILDSLGASVLQQRLQSLRYLWLCGEVVSRDLAVTFAQLLPHVELMNLYSISECHDVAIGDLKREIQDMDDSCKYATCGTAIPGVHFYIVDLERTEEDEDGHMHQVTLGETGEVYVGGPVVGRGYLNMPEKTAERFVPNPFDQDPSCPRLYRTGDLGRLLPNGQLEILGRCDFMVKIRGYSVVLGAIETALAKHPRLSSSVVLAVGAEGSRDGKKLVAYVVPTQWSDPPSAASVRSFLKHHVPPYAIPSTFCVIDALPVAASAAGKLDRKKLPAHETAKRLRAFSEDLTTLDATNTSTTTTTSPPTTTTQRLAPQNETEEAILDIWCKLLEVSTEELSALDSFFEVGGHSLLAVKLVALVNNKFGKTTSNGLSIVSVVEGPTIRDMAEIITEGESSKKKIVIDLQSEADALDPSIYPFPTRKGNTMARFRLEASALLHPRVVFLTGATGYLGVHILAELLQAGVTVIALARAKTDEGARERLLNTLEKHQLLDALQHHNNSTTTSETISEGGGEDILESRLVAIAGDLSKPLLGMDNLQFKSLALEIDSIIHCGAEVNLIKPYASLKESNVMGTQEILRLATTNGFVKTKVKPVHYISTNGVFPVDPKAYPEQQRDNLIVVCQEDVKLQDLSPHLTEGYAMTKWVAEQMCTIAESRGLPVSVLRPGNMAGSSVTGVQNPDDFNYLLLQGMIAAKCAPIVDTKYALDLTPVDFAARAVVHLAVHAPQKAMGQRFHLQSPQTPVALAQVAEWLRGMGYAMEGVTRDEWIKRIEGDEKLSSGWLSFEKYFEASTWLQFGSDRLQQACGDELTCPTLDTQLLERWFPKL
jgi:amino acid adenylation domain-containing protein/thioester reductase-like protein